MSSSSDIEKTLQDVEIISQMDTWAEIQSATYRYLMELADDLGYHIDYMRDACEGGMTSKDSPFSHWFSGAYEYQYGEKYSEENEDHHVIFDDLHDFAKLQDDESIFNFLIIYLSAMRWDTSCWSNGQKLPRIMKIDSKYWKPMFQASFIQTIDSLKWRAPRPDIVSADD